MLFSVHLYLLHFLALLIECAFIIFDCEPDGQECNTDRMPVQINGHWAFQEGHIQCESYSNFSCSGMGIWIDHDQDEKWDPNMNTNNCMSHISHLAVLAHIFEKCKVSNNYITPIRIGRTGRAGKGGQLVHIVQIVHIIE